MLIFQKLFLYFYYLGQNNGFVPSQPQQPFFNAFNNNGFPPMQSANNIVRLTQCIYCI